MDQFFKLQALNELSWYQNLSNLEDQKKKLEDELMQLQQEKMQQITDQLQFNSNQKAFPQEKGKAKRKNVTFKNPISEVAICVSPLEFAIKEMCQNEIVNQNQPLSINKKQKKS